VGALSGAGRYYSDRLLARILLHLPQQRLDSRRLRLERSHSIRRTYIPADWLCFLRYL